MNTTDYTEDQFVQLLDTTGFIDLTKYQQNLTPGKESRTIHSPQTKGLKK